MPKAKRTIKRAIGLLTLWVLLVILIPVQFSSFSKSEVAYASGSQGQVSWLHTNGIYVYDQSGSRFGLLGVNFFYGEGTGIGLADFQKAKSLGFNSIRLIVFWKQIQPFNETLQGMDESYFTTGEYPLGHGLDQVVNWAVQENMYIIICPAWGTYWTPPSWAFPNISDDHQRYTALISGTAVKARVGFVNTWRYIANRYQNTPNVIFELLNEPFVLDRSLAGNAYKTFNEEVISAIESMETASHLKLTQPLIDDTDGAWLPITDVAMDVSEPNVLWATHNYSPMDTWDPTGKYWHDSFTWHGQAFQEGWGNGTTYAAWTIIRVALKIHSWNRPWISTEFSKDTRQTLWKSWYDIVLQTMNENSISGWMYFCYISNPTSVAYWNINNPLTQQMLMPVLDSYLPLGQIADNSTASSTTTSSTSTSSSTTTSSTITTTSNSTSYLVVKRRY